MKTIEKVIFDFQQKALDGRDLYRLARFVKESDLPKIGVTIKEEYTGKHEPIEFTREKILECLKDDLEFAF